MLTLAAAFLLKLLKLQVKWVHQQKRRTIVFRKRAKNFQPLLVKFGWVIHKFGLIKTRSQNTRNWTNYFAHCSHFSSPLRGLEILLRKCFNLVVFSILTLFFQLNSRVHELKELELLPFQRQTQIPSQVFTMFLVSIHTCMFESILDTLKIVTPSFAVFLPITD